MNSTIQKKLFHILSFLNEKRVKRVRKMYPCFFCKQRFYVTADENTSYFVDAFKVTYMLPSATPVSLMM